MHVPKEQKIKLDENSLRYIILGYSTKSKGYKLIYPTTWNIYIRRDIIFYKTCESSTSPPTKVSKLNSPTITNYDHDDDEIEALVVN